MESNASSTAASSAHDEFKDIFGNVKDVDQVANKPTEDFNKPTEDTKPNVNKPKVKRPADFAQKRKAKRDADTAKKWADAGIAAPPLKYARFAIGLKMQGARIESGVGRIEDDVKLLKEGQVRMEKQMTDNTTRLFDHMRASVPLLTPPPTRPQTRRSGR